MTFDSAISSTYEGAVTDMRDKIGGMTNWSVVEDAWSGSEYFVIQTPLGEYIKIGQMNSNNALGVVWGPDYDAGSSSWNTQWASFTEINAVNANSNHAWTDSATYWMNYVDGAGFLWYLQREEGDGNDADMALGFAEINKTWSYDTAANDESEYTMWMEGRDQYSDSTQYDNRVANGSEEYDGGYGMVNPDANFSNYPYVETVQESNTYRNANSEDAVIGTHDFWIQDRSGGDSAHRDTVQNSSGTDVYTLLKRNICTVGMGMQ